VKFVSEREHHQPPPHLFWWPSDYAAIDDTSFF
jgi:hypothetical protein